MFRADIRVCVPRPQGPEGCPLTERRCVSVAGDAAPAVEWLRENVQRHGGLKRPRPLIEEATGADVSPEPLLSYLEAKFGQIYGL